jgi:two-component system response regulator DesR
MIKVLIVDDQTGYRRALAVWLGERGFLVEVAASADAALEAARVFRPDVAVVDQALKDRMHGSELSAALRTLLPCCATVAISGCLVARPPGSERAGWLSKPFEPDDLVSAIRDVLRGDDAGVPGAGTEQLG